MIEPGSLDLTIYQGATFDYPLIWESAPSTPVNLTGCSARLFASKRYNVPHMIEMSTSNGRIALGGSAGTINLSMTAADTALLPASVYYYDLEILYPDNTVTRLLMGKLKVSAEIPA